MPPRIPTIAALFVLLATPLAVLAETLDEVEVKIAEAYAKHKTIAAKMKFTTDVKTDDFALKSEGESTTELKRVGEKTYLLRMESKSKDLRKMKGQEEEKAESHTLMVVDGKHSYVLTESGATKSAMKQKLDPKKNPSPFDVASLFKEQDKSYTLKLLPAEKVDGKECWVIEAKPKKDGENQMMARMVTHYCKKTGVGLKTASYDPSGRQMMSSVVTDLKLNADLAEDRFTFKAPESVQVMDMDALQKDQQTEGSEDKAESLKSDAKSAEQKESADAAPEQKPEPKKTEKKKGLGGLLDKVVK